jgi:hypothetical protein
MYDNNNITQVEHVANLPLSVYHQFPLPPASTTPQLPAPCEVTVVRDVVQRPEFNELAVGTNLTKAPRNWLTDDRRV